MTGFCFVGASACHIRILMWNAHQVIRWAGLVKHVCDTWRKENTWKPQASIRFCYIQVRKRPQRVTILTRSPCYCPCILTSCVTVKMRVPETWLSTFHTTYCNLLSDLKKQIYKIDILNAEICNRSFAKVKRKSLGVFFGLTSYVTEYRPIA